MRLKEIEINGFKSFADKTKISLDKDLTIIVGPNGSGKSNIADAVLWAIGEQSPKSLRGSKMVDVIFHGNKKRLPSGSAEVFLLFEKDDGGRVKIGRRLTRGGESYYLMDDNVVRLKDVHEFCYKNNISPHGNFIVEQGRVEAILAMSPEERRGLFEDVAKISHYKENRKSAESKLQSTRNNLIRLNDIINEVANELSGLKKQAQKADKYLKLLEEEKVKKRTYFGKSLLAIKIKKGYLKNELELYYDEKSKQEAKLASVVSILEEKKLRKNEEERSNSLINEKLHQLEISKERIEQENKRKFDQILMSKERLKEIESDLSTIEAKLKERNKFYNSLLERKEYVEEERRKISSSIEERSKILEGVKKKLEEIQKNIQLKQKENFSLAEERSSKKSFLIQIEEEKRKLVERENRHQRESERLKREKEKAEETLFNEEARLKDKKRRLSEKEDELKSISTKLSSIIKEREEISKKIIEIEKNIAAENSKLQVLTEQESLLKTKTEVALEKKHPSLKEKRLFLEFKNLPEKTLTLLELLLGNFITSYTIETTSELEEILKSIQGEIRDRLFFLIKSNEEERKGIKIEPKYKSFVGFVSDLEGFPQFLKNHIKDIPRFSDFNEAFLFTKDNKFPSLTSNDSLLILEDGFVVLGPLNEISISTVKIGIEIENTKLKIDKLSKEILRIESEKKKIEEEEEKVKSLQRTILKEKEEIEKEIQEVRISLQKAESELKRIYSYEELEKLEFSEIKRNQEELDEEISKIKETLLKIENNILKVQGELSFFEEEKRRLENEFEKAQENFTLFRLKEKEWEEKKKTILNEENNLLLMIKELGETKERLTNDGELLNQKIKKLEKGIIEDEEHLSEILHNINEGNEKRATFLSTIRNLEEEISKVEKEEKEIKSNILEIEKEINEREKSLAILESEEENIFKMFSSDFEEDISNIINEFKDETLISSEEKNNLLNEIHQIQKKKEALAPLNLLAKEEYESKSKRLNFLTEQKKDLEKAISDLETTIRKINESIKSRFLEAFDAINTNFSQLFRIVFGGGDAYLSLLDKENPLESGIDIFAQPQGKKVVHNIQLSGGEKALVALTLLFAIISYKPQVFFLLDEIDAPLDDANIEKVLSKLLKEFSDRTQFIVISHNKRTMELGNTIYGVTMQESGVSKIFSVSLKEV